MPSTLPPAKLRTQLRVSPETAEADASRDRQPEPLERTEMELLRTDASAAKPPSNAGRTLIAPPQSILVIDDNPAEAEQLISILTGLYPRNLRISQRESGQSGLDLARRSNLDVIFVGYRMTDMDGTEFISHAAGLTDDTAMILLGSAWDGPGTAAAMKSGARDFLDKSRMDAFLVREVIETALRSVRIDYRLTKTAATLRTRNETNRQQMDSLTWNVKSTFAALSDTLRELRDSARNLTVWELDEHIGQLQDDLRASRDLVNQLTANEV